MHDKQSKKCESVLVPDFNHILPSKNCLSFLSFLEVIIDAYVEAGLVLENDAKQKLKVN